MILFKMVDKISQDIWALQNLAYLEIQRPRDGDGFIAMDVLINFIWRKDT